MQGDQTIPLLREFRLTAMAEILKESIQMAEQSNWGYGEFMNHLCENELQERKRKKINRLLKASRLPEGKTISTLQQDFLPVEIRKTIPSLVSGDFVKTSTNVLAFGLPGRGKTHFLCAIGRELILKHQYKVLFIPTFKLIQELLVAKKELELEKALKKYDAFDVIILDDIGYIQHTRDEMEILFTFFADRYERKSLMITSNLPFSKWDHIFKDPMTAMAAIDRLVHHSKILEFSGNSIRTKQAEASIK
ncbi:MAG: ATP-binding protein [Proteobacteria bacterium]|nr:ATP-binding protein [Pseudomonadota bacterium]